MVNKVGQTINRDFRKPFPSPRGWYLTKIRPRLSDFRLDLAGYFLHQVASANCSRSSHTNTNRISSTQQQNAEINTLDIYVRQQKKSSTNKQTGDQNHSLLRTSHTQKTFCTQQRERGSKLVIYVRHTSPPPPTVHKTRKIKTRINQNKMGTTDRNPAEAREGAHGRGGGQCTRDQVPRPSHRLTRWKQSANNCILTTSRVATRGCKWQCSCEFRTVEKEAATRNLVKLISGILWSMYVCAYVRSNVCMHYFMYLCVCPPRTCPPKSNKWRHCRCPAPAASWSRSWRHLTHGARAATKHQHTHTHDRGQNERNRHNHAQQITHSVRRNTNPLKKQKTLQIIDTTKQIIIW